MIKHVRMYVHTCRFTCVLSVKYVCAGVEDTREGESKTDVKAEIIFMYLLSIYFKHSLLN